MTVLQGKKIIDIKNIKFLHKSAITIGKFEGLHLGHTKLINLTTQYALTHNLSSLLFSFTPHPYSVLYDKTYSSIFSDNEKIFIIKKMGVDFLLLYPFEKEFANLEAKVFAEFLFNDLSCAALFVGKNFKFGKNLSGDFCLLQNIATNYGAQVTEIDFCLDNNIRISSSRIRKAITANNFLYAEQMMGRPYFIMEKIVHGKALGRKLGFPTINMIVETHKLLPSYGVYITETLHKKTLYKSITNVGINPTIADSFDFVTVETHLLDSSVIMYGEMVQVFFKKKLRDEIHFARLKDLQNQLKQDVQMAREYHNN